MIDKKNILITGLNGFLGSHLAKHLSINHDIIGLEVNTHNMFRLKGYDFKIYDSDKTELEKLFAHNKLFAVIHTATMYRRENDPFEQFYNTNILLPVRLMVLAEKFDVPLFINTDSFFNRKGSKQFYLADYTLSKKHAIEWLYLIQKKCKLVNMKLFHMYGPGDSLNKFVPSIASALMSNQPFLDLTRGKQKRDLIYIDDVVSAYQTILNNHQKLLQNINEFEVGTGKSTSIEAFVRLFKLITGSKTDLRFGALPYVKNEIMDAYADTKKLKALGWRVKFSIEEGIKNLVRNANTISL